MSIPHVTNLFQAFLTGLTAAFVTLLAFIPPLLGAIALVVVGWILSGWIARVVTALLTRVGFNAAADRTGVTGFMRQSGLQRESAAWVIGEIVKWFIRLIFLELAAQALGLTAVTSLLDRIVLWIPNLIVALVILMLGALLGRVLGDLVRGFAAESGIGNPDVLAQLARLAVIGFALLVALNQVGVASALVQELFIAVVGALALAFGLAFGLGGRDVAGQITRQWYETRPRSDSVAGSGSGLAASMPPPAAAPGPPPAEPPPLEPPPPGPPRARRSRA